MDRAGRIAKCRLDSLNENQCRCILARGLPENLRFTDMRTIIVSGALISLVFMGMPFAATAQGQLVECYRSILSL